MTLNKYTKQAIVSSILNDLPKVNEAELKKEIQDAFLKAMSIPYRNVFKKNPKGLQTLYVGYNEGFSYGTSVFVGDADIDEVMKPYRTAVKERHKIERELEAAIGTCSTRKQFIDRFPEFSKYAPSEEGKTQNLPAIANIVADLVKLGWKQTISKSSVPQPA